MGLLTPFDRLKRWRLERGIRQREAAAILGTNQSGYCLIENGERKPSLELIPVFNKHLGTTFQDWIDAKTKRQRAKGGKAA